jgi:hypothetical protein
LELDDLISRAELTAMLFSIHDIEEHLRVIRDLLTEEGDGQEDPEDDA